MIMRDYAETDKRSVAAQLRGKNKGDDRVKMWEKFREKQFAVTPHIDEEQMAMLYEAHTRDMEEAQKRTAIAVLKRLFARTVAVAKGPQLGLD